MRAARPGPSALLLALLGASRVASASAAPDAPPASGADSARVAAGAALDPAPTGPASLEPSAGVPWNPPRHLSSSEPWEAAVRFPGRVVSLPLVTLGAATDRLMLTLETRGLLGGALGGPTRNAHPPGSPLRSSFNRLPILPPIGLSIAPPRVGSRTGVGATVVVNPPWAGGLLEADFSATTLHYHRTLLSAVRGPGIASYSYEWRPQDQFYGLGSLASESDRSSYAAWSRQVRLELGYPWKPGTSRRRGAAARAWVGSREQVLSRGRESGAPSFDQIFPTLASSTLDRPYENLLYGARLSYDGRRGAPHWSRGLRVAYQAERVDDAPDALRLGAASGPSSAPAEFSHQIIEIETGFGIMRDPRTARLAIRIVDTDYGGDIARMQIPDLATLGAGAGLAGFRVGRYHDLDSAVGKLTYIIPLARRMELDLHAEAGHVYRSVWDDLQPKTMRKTVGAALRLRTKDRVLGWLGLDWSRESRRLAFDFQGER